MSGDSDVIGVYSELLKFGSFYRALRLPDTVDTNKIESHYDNGVLTITMPKADEKNIKQIQVKITGGSKAIEGKK